MNVARIREATTQIEAMQAALKWLTEYGPRLTGKDKDDAEVRVHLNYASATPGAKEAADILSSYARLDLPAIVETSIRSCQNSIVLWRDAIAAELAKDES